jgi:hypothetical protein
MNEKANAIDSVWVRREAERALHLFERLTSHTAFLEEVRERKAKGGASLGLEREVILHAQEAEHDARDLAAATLRLAAHLNNAGMFEEALREWAHWLNAKRQVKAKNVWAKIARDLKLQNHLHKAGVPDSFIEWLEQQFGKASFSFGVNISGEPTARSDDGKFEVTFAAPAKLGQPKSLSDLLFARRVETTIAALEELARVVVPVLPARITEDGKTRITIMDGVLGGSVFYLQEFTRRRRQFEDAGLPAINGKFIDPGTAISLGIAALIGAGFLLDLCNKKPGVAVCTAGVILAVLAAFLIGGGFAELGLTASGLESSANDWWELRAGDIPAYQNIVQGRF